QRSAAKIYKVPFSTLSDRMAGRTYSLDTKANTNVQQKLIKLEEKVFIRNILDMDSREFAPRLADVEDMASFILVSREGGGETRRQALGSSICTTTTGPRDAF
ncbi:hypothetical protein BJ878DRAFT_516650, partial [Calycina marina]